MLIFSVEIQYIINIMITFNLCMDQILNLIMCQLAITKVSYVVNHILTTKTNFHCLYMISKKRLNKYFVSQ